MMRNQTTLGQLMTQLTQEGYFSAERAEQLQTYLATPVGASESPWYVKLLVGISAWLAALFLGFFFSLTGLVDSSTSMVVVGLILCAVSAGVKHLVGNSIFWSQLAFAFSLAGQGLSIAGIADWTDNTTQTALLAALLEGVLFVFYPDLLHRLISVLAVIAAAVVVLYDQHLGNGIHALTMLTALGAVALWQAEVHILGQRWGNFHAPLIYGLPIALFAICGLAQVGLFPSTYWWISAVGLALVLLYLGYQILSDLAIPPQSAVGLWFVASLVLVMIPAWQTPGIVAALIVLLVAYWRGNTLLLGLAMLFLLLFLGAYYYNLDITLLNKSYILMGTGVVLLALRSVFTRYVRQPVV